MYYPENKETLSLLFLRNERTEYIYDKVIYLYWQQKKDSEIRLSNKTNILSKKLKKY